MEKLGLEPGSFGTLSAPAQSYKELTEMIMVLPLPQYILTSAPIQVD